MGGGGGKEGRRRGKRGREMEVEREAREKLKVGLEGWGGGSVKL